MEITDLAFVGHMGSKVLPPACANVETFTKHETMGGTIFAMDDSPL